MQRVALIGDPAFAQPAWAAAFVRRHLVMTDVLYLARMPGPTAHAYAAAHGFLAYPPHVFPLVDALPRMLARGSHWVVVFADHPDADPFIHSTLAWARHYQRRVVIQYSTGWAFEEDPEGGAEQPFTRWHWRSFIE